MKKYKNLFFLIGITTVLSAFLYWIAQAGRRLESGRKIILPNTTETDYGHFINSFIHNLGEPLAILLLQIITIIFIARFLGWICKMIGQPTVIGEILAGIILGPSLVGYYFPEFSAKLFPVESLGNLQFLSQIGLILFMFIVGMELDLKTIKSKANDAVVISFASIIIPFTLGMGLAYYIFLSFAPQGVRFSSFGMFLGIAMSITAFPVLARIVFERGLHKTRLGAIVITSAAANDIAGWSLLAAVIAIVKAGSFFSSIYNILMAIVYVIVMLKVVRPFLKRVGDLHSSRENLSKPVVAIFLVTLLLSSYATEIIGIHALFGAFMAGVIMPHNPRFRNIFIEKIEDVALVMLLPLFFVFTGLRTEIGLINDPYLWKITGLIILVAIVGKFIGSAMAAKFVGQSWRDSLTIGALMNTRGLMELVVLNIGYDLGVITPEIFAMMVIMALLTTFMTGPLLDLINKMFKKKSQVDLAEINQISKFRILISFASPAKSRLLLRLAESLVRKLNNNASITVMHIAPNNELNQVNIIEYEKSSFAPILDESKKLNQKITTLFKVSNDINNEITEEANKGDYDLLLVGLGQSIFEGSVLGRVLGFTNKIINPERLFSTAVRKEKLFEKSPFEERTRLILAKSEVPVGILIEKKAIKTENIFLPLFEADDIFLISYAQKFIHNSGSHITVMDMTGKIQENREIMETIDSIRNNAPNNIQFLYENKIDDELLKHKDLMLLSLDSWKKVVELQTYWLADAPTTLIIKPDYLNLHTSPRR